MRAIKSFFFYAFFIILILGAYGMIKPYWNKYWIHRDMENAAIYGTKHDRKSTLAFLMKKMKQEDRTFNEEDFIIDKDEDRKVTITLRYKDQIGLFGFELKELHFTVTASATEIKEYY
ncbi:MAG: hypothetical protein JW836_00085 [Deltaproteobacteria bacterium]|nr:hypothetical protein [Deltaproteobacteria bacterium]